MRQPATIGGVSETGTGTSQSLERGLAILSAFDSERPLIGVSELSRELSLSRSTAHRYIATLAQLGYLQQDPDSKRYRLGPKVLDLGFSAINSMDVREISAPHLRRLSDETGHTVNLAIVSEDRREELIARIDFVVRGPNTITDADAFRVELERIRAAGIAVNDEELAYGLRSIAAPIQA